jgi:predicted lipoprotein
MKKMIKYILVLLVVALVGYKSVYFKKLSEVNQTGDKKFDAAGWTKKLWEEKLTPGLDSAIDLMVLIDKIQTNPTEAFDKYTHAMSIGNYRYALVKVPVFIEQVEPDDIKVHLLTNVDTTIGMILATEYIYGNAIRDASGLVDIRDFTNTTDLNNISEELNKIVRQSVLPPFKANVKVGDKVEVIAAVELNKEHINFKELELIPVRLKTLQ